MNDVNEGGLWEPLEGFWALTLTGFPGDGLSDQARGIVQEQIHTISSLQVTWEHRSQIEDQIEDHITDHTEDIRKLIEQLPLSKYVKEEALATFPDVSDAQIQKILLALTELSDGYTVLHEEQYEVLYEARLDLNGLYQQRLEQRQRLQAAPNNSTSNNSTSIPTLRMATHTPTNLGVNHGIYTLLETIT